MEEIKKKKKFPSIWEDPIKKKKEGHSSMSENQRNSEKTNEQVHKNNETVKHNINPAYQKFVVFFPHRWT